MEARLPVHFQLPPTNGFLLVCDIVFLVFSMYLLSLANLGVQIPRFLWQSHFAEVYDAQAENDHEPLES